MIKIEFDPAKRALALKVHGVDFEDASEFFEGETFDRHDNRRDYGEVRIVSFGFLRARMFVVVWTERGNVRRIISMRKANEREQTRFGQRFREN